MLIVALLLMCLCAFPKSIRVQMFKRDNAECKECGKKWDDGWMLHAAHYKEGDNSLSNGRMLCVRCHIKDHEEKFRKARDKKVKNQHAYAIRRLKWLSVYNWKKR